MVLSLSRSNEHVYRVLAEHGEHVGNLKLINGVWKFKAIGYEPNGDVIPGGGPLTDRHNTTFVALDETLISATLGRTSDTDDAWNFNPRAIAGKLA